MQLIRVSLQPFEVLPQGARDCLFHRVWLLCHSWFVGSFARNTPFSDCVSQPPGSQPPSGTYVPNRCLTASPAAQLFPFGIPLKQRRRATKGTPSNFSGIACMETASRSGRDWLPRVPEVWNRN